VTLDAYIFSLELWTEPTLKGRGSQSAQGEEVGVPGAIPKAAHCNPAQKREEEKNWRQI
jgi:hypothetical protein